MNANDYNDYNTLNDDFNILNSEFKLLMREFDSINQENYKLRYQIDKFDNFFNDKESMLDNIDFSIIESYVRKTKLKRINEK